VAEPPPSASAAPAQAPPSPPPGPLALGETAEAPDYAFKLEQVKTCEGTRIQPKPGHVRLGVKVMIEGRSSNEVPVNPFYARLHDKQRDGYGYAATFGGCEPDLKSARVKKGDRMTGFITFEIPAQASGLELVYSPYIRDSDTTEQPVRFALGR
jgi:hypothetical protein